MDTVHLIENYEKVARILEMSDKISENTYEVKAFRDEFFYPVKFSFFADNNMIIGIEYSINNRTLKSISSLDVFLKLFIDLKVYPDEPVFISTNDMSVIGKKRIIYNKNNIAVRMLPDGSFIVNHKQDVPSKEEVKDYERYKDNLECIWIKYRLSDKSKAVYKWYSSLDEFFKEVPEFKGMSSSESLSKNVKGYKIIRQGMFKTHPYDRNIYLKLPHLDVKHMYNIFSKEYKEESVIRQHIINMWSNIVNKRFDMKDYKYDSDVVKKIITTTVNSFLDLKV